MFYYRLCVKYTKERAKTQGTRESKKRRRGDDKKERVKPEKRAAG